MNEITLGDGSTVIVDEEDFAQLSHFKWSAQGNGYGFRRVRNSDGKYDKVYLHRLIMQANKGEYVDHINGDKRDNRKSNLRICTNAENSRNSKKKNSSSKYKGITFDKYSEKWVAQIMLNGKNIFLGSFKTEKDAAIRYNEGAIKYHGEFAKLNEFHEEETA